MTKIVEKHCLMQQADVQALIISAMPKINTNRFQSVAKGCFHNRVNSKG